MKGGSEEMKGKREEAIERGSASEREEVRKQKPVAFENDPARHGVQEDPPAHFEPHSGSGTDKMCPLHMRKH